MPSRRPVGISISLLFDKSLYVRRSDLVQFHVAEGRQQMVFGDALLCSQATFSQVCISVPGSALRSSCLSHASQSLPKVIVPRSATCMLSASSRSILVANSSAWRLL